MQREEKRERRKFFFWQKRKRKKKHCVTCQKKKKKLCCPNRPKTRSSDGNGVQPSTKCLRKTLPINKCAAAFQRGRELIQSRPQWSATHKHAHLRQITRTQDAPISHYEPMQIHVEGAIWPPPAEFCALGSEKCFQETESHLYFIAPPQGCWRLGSGASGDPSKKFPWGSVAS